jgi:hypothetical protein
MNGGYFMNRNFDENKMTALLNTVSKKIGVPPEKLKSELESGKFDNALSGMKGQDAERFKRVLKNPQLIEKMMSTPQAKALYEKLSGGNK